MEKASTAAMQIQRRRRRRHPLAAWPDKIAVLNIFIFHRVQLAPCCMAKGKAGHVCPVPNDGLPPVVLFCSPASYMAGASARRKRV